MTMEKYGVQDVKAQQEKELEAVRTKRSELQAELEKTASAEGKAREDVKEAADELDRRATELEEALRPVSDQ